jgi:deazaflavin-dependent oxidoreductase (nitroreductase family)
VQESVWLRRCAKRVEEAAGWYLHIDVDVAGPEVVPGGLTPAPYWPPRHHLIDAAAAITRSVPVDVVSGAMTDRKDYNRHLIEEFRANAGKVAGAWTMALLLLTTTGVKSVKLRTKPMGYLPDDDRLLVTASNLGAPAHPDWYYNLLAHLQVTVEVGPETFDATADLMEGEERQTVLQEQLPQIAVINMT